MSKKEVRKTFKEKVFKRDGYCCRWCGNGPFYEISDSMFDAHHITDRSEMPNGGYVEENGITLCKNPLGLTTVEGECGLPDFKIQENSCHMKAETFHITNGELWEEGMHPDDLYKLIGSSKELAIEKSNNLK